MENPGHLPVIDYFFHWFDCQCPGTSPKLLFFRRSIRSFDRNYIYPGPSQPYFYTENIHKMKTRYYTLWTMIFLGLTTAVLYILDRLNPDISVPEYFFSWPMGLVITGACCLLIDPAGHFGVFMMGAGLVVVLSGNIELSGSTALAWWPGLLILAGAGLGLSGPHKKIKENKHHPVSFDRMKQPEILIS